MTDPGDTMMGEDAFDARYEPQPNPEDGSLYWTEEQVRAAGIPLERTWTVIDGDDGITVYVAAGIHRVNAFALAVTVFPWETGDEEAIFATLG